MKTVCISLLIYVLAGCRVEGHYVAPDSSPPGDVLWAKQIGGSESDRGRGIAIDSKRNLIAIGSFRQTINPSAELTSIGEDDIYIVKLDSSTGDVIWAKRIGSKQWDGVFGVAVDMSDNIYIGGYFAGSIDFGGGTLTAASVYAAFVLKLDVDGRFGWARKIDGSGTSGYGVRGFPGAIATDGNSVVVVNNYFGSVTVDTTTLTSAEIDMVVLKLSASSGATRWVRSFGGTSDDLATGLALDNSGDLVITGEFNGTINFGGGPFSSEHAAGFLLKLASTDGSHLISKPFGGTGMVYGSALAVDAANNILVTGVFDGAMDLGCPENLRSSQEGLLSDAFLAKYTQAGSCIWARGIGGASGHRGAAAIALSGSGDTTIVGDFCGSISSKNEVLSSASARILLDGFAARVSGDGRFLGAIRTGGTSDDHSLGIAQGNDGRLFMTGLFGGFSEFGRDSLTAIGDSDAFIVGFTPL